MCVLCAAADVHADDGSPTGQAAEAPEAKRTEAAAEGYFDAPVFLPRSYLYWGSPVGGDVAPEKLIFALEYAFHLPAYNNLREAAARGAGWAGAATLSFAGALRMLAQTSSPVRMPSYRPSLSGQLFRILYGRFPLLTDLHLELAHHSNGQEYCIFDATLKDETEACRVAVDEVQDPAESLNRYTGNFSNNSVLIGVDVRGHEVDALGHALGHLGAGFTLSVILPEEVANSPLKLRRQYGNGDVASYVEVRHRFGRSDVRLSAHVRHFFGTDPSVPTTSGILQVVLRPYRLVGFGFFARYYGGRDFYNAFFVDRIQQFATGLSWDGERPLTFHRP